MTRIQSNHKQNKCLLARSPIRVFFNNFVSHKKFWNIFDFKNESHDWQHSLVHGWTGKETLKFFCGLGNVQKNSSAMNSTAVWSENCFKNELAKQLSTKQKLLVQKPFKLIIPM